MRFEPSTNPSVASVGRSGGCTVHVAAIEDKRSHRDRFGSSPEFKLFAEHVPQWLATGIQMLTSPDYVLSVGAHSTVAAAIELTVHLHQAYVHHNATTKNANIALTVSYRQAGRPAESKLYRGLDTSINWSSSPNEIEAAMNRALNHVLTGISQDLRERCGTRAAHGPKM